MSMFGQAMADFNNPNAASRPSDPESPKDRPITQPAAARSTATSVVDPEPHPNDIERDDIDPRIPEQPKPVPEQVPGDFRDAEPETEEPFDDDVNELDDTDDEFRYPDSPPKVVTPDPDPDPDDDEDVVIAWGPDGDVDEFAPPLMPNESVADSSDDDDDRDDRSGDIRMKGSSALSGLLGKPKEFFAEHPTWKRPAMFGGIGLVVALVIAVVFGGGSPASETPTPPPPAVTEEPVGGPANAEPVTLLPKNVSASCPPGSTSATLAFSNRPEEAWVCGRAMGADGAIFNIQFGRMVQVQSVTISPGWNYVAPNGKDNWNEHRLITQLLWRLGSSGGKQQQFIQKINPTRAGSTFTFPGSGIATTEMSFTIQKTERPNAVGAEGVEGGVDGGGVLPPIAGGGADTPDNDKVDESTAVNSLTITGVDLN